MGSIEKRIEALERRCGIDEDPEARERRPEARRADILGRLGRVIDQEKEKERG
jgi:hypothetical protein